MPITMGTFVVGGLDYRFGHCGFISNVLVLGVVFDLLLVGRHYVLLSSLLAVACWRVISAVLESPQRAARNVRPASMLIPTFILIVPATFRLNRARQGVFETCHSTHGRLWGSLNVPSKYSAVVGSLAMVLVALIGSDFAMCETRSLSS